MGPRIELAAAGVKPAADELEALAHRARDARPLMKRFLVDLVVIEREQFQSKGERLGRGWPDLNEDYKARKQADGLDTRPERRTGRLWLSLTQTKGPDAIRRASRQSVTEGTRVWYGNFQGKDKREGRGTRVLLGQTAHDQEHFAARTVGWLMDGAL